MARRMGMMIGLRPEAVATYRQMHIDVWPGVLEKLREVGISNYSIFLREPENVLFGYWEYAGDDFAADIAAVASDPLTREWWRVCDPLQVPLETRKEDEWWAAMEQVFYMP